MAITDRNTYKASDLIATNILLSYDDDAQVWVAHSLELDIVEDGPKKTPAIRNLLTTLNFQVSSCIEKGLDYIEIAPSEYWAQWQFASPFSVGDEFDSADLHFHMAVREREAKSSLARHFRLTLDDMTTKLQRFGIAKKEGKGTLIMLEGNKIESGKSARYAIDRYKSTREIHANLLTAILRRFEISFPDFFEDSIH